MEHVQASRTDWSRGLADLAQGDLRALLWLRSDVHVHDFLLADRVLALPPGQWLLRDAQGHEAMRIATAADAPVQDGVTLACSVSVREGQRLHPLTQAQAAPPLLLVTASRASASDFYTQTALGRSLQPLRQAGLDIKVMARCQNQRPLGEVYNAAMTPDFAGHTVVFAHDDITLHDWHLPRQLDLALRQFDVVGVAGCRSAQPGQPGWAFENRVGQWKPASQLLGCVGHDTREHHGPGRKMRLLSRYGAPTGAAALLDGVLLAARMDTLLQSGLRFDPSLAFHFYDLDFCRAACQRGLQPGVWPLAITHDSGGAFDSPGWRHTLSLYQQKWGDPPPRFPT